MIETLPRKFQIQPESNNSATLWVRDYPLQVIADNYDLIIMFDTEDFEAVIVGNGVHIQRIKKRNVPTIEEVSGLLDLGERAIFD